MYICRLSADFFFKINIFKEFFLEHYQSVKRSWSGSKLFAKQQRLAADDKSQERKELILWDTFKFQISLKWQTFIKSQLNYLYHDFAAFPLI